MTDNVIAVGTIVETSKDYEVRVWAGTDKEATGEYGVYNKTYGVLEVSTPLLAQALIYLHQLQGALDNRDAEVEAEKKSHLAPVSSINPSDVH